MNKNKIMTPTYTRKFKESPGNIKKGVQKFLSTGAPLADGDKMIGRWHAPGSVNGWIIIETDKYVLLVLFFGSLFYCVRSNCFRRELGRVRVPFRSLRSSFSHHTYYCSNFVRFFFSSFESFHNNTALRDCTNTPRNGRTCWIGT